MTTHDREIMVSEYDNDPVESVHRVGRSLLLFAGSSVTVFFLGFTVYLLEIVKQWFFILAYLALAGVGILILCAIAAPIIFLLRWLFNASSHDIGPNGLAFRGLFGRVDTVAPMNAPAGVKLAPERKQKKDAPVIPLLSMLDMIDQGIISPGQVKVVLGYTDKNELEVQKRPNVYVIAGKGRSGKSRRATLMIGQDLIALAPMLNLKDRLQGARVMICDPHGLGKKDSLRRLLEPLAPWIEFASTEQEVRKLTSEYIEEMERRLANTSTLGNQDGSYIPWVLYYDEWSRFMTKYEDDFTELLTNAVQSSAQEYAGVDGYVALLGQDWTNDACGGTAIRRAIQEAFIHNISSEYAAFLLPKGLGARKWVQKAESLRVKDCIYKNYESQIKQLVTPHVADEVPARLAEIMQELCPVDLVTQPTKEIPESTARPKSPGEPPSYTRYRHAITDTLPEQMTEYPGYPNTPLLLSPSYGEPYTGNFEHTGEHFHEAETAVNALERSGESIVNSKQVEGETFTAQVNTSKPVSPALAFTPEQEIQVVNAAFQVTRENGGRVTRSDIMEKLGWTRAQWPIIKGVCDKHNIAKQ